MTKETLSLQWLKPDDVVESLLPDGLQPGPVFVYGPIVPIYYERRYSPGAKVTRPLKAKDPRVFMHVFRIPIVVGDAGQHRIEILQYREPAKARSRWTWEIAIGRYTVVDGNEQWGAPERKQGRGKGMWFQTEPSSPPALTLKVNAEMRDVFDSSGVGRSGFVGSPSDGVRYEVEFGL